MIELCHKAAIMFCLFLIMLWVGLQCVVLAVIGHTHLIFLTNIFYTVLESAVRTT